MGLFNRQKEVAVPPELASYYDTGAANWRKRLVRALVAIVLIALVVALVRFLWHETHTADKKTPAGNSSQSHRQPDSSNTNYGQPSPPANNSNSANSSPSSSQNQTSSTSGAQPGSASLANTGPGATPIVFVVASLVGSGLYQVRLRRKPAA